MGIHEVELPLHIHPDFIVENNGRKILAKSKRLKARIMYSSDSGQISLIRDDKKYCNYSEEYGDRRFCNAIIFKDTVNLPYRLETRIKIEELY